MKFHSERASRIESIVYGDRSISLFYDWKLFEIFSDKSSELTQRKFLIKFLLIYISDEAIL